MPGPPGDDMANDKKDKKDKKDKNVSGIPYVATVRESRTRDVKIVAEDEASAREKALTEADGEENEVLSIQPLFRWQTIEEIDKSVRKALDKGLSPDELQEIFTETFKKYIQ